ncbi:MAG TPA: sensor domain-containing diguanylate cyclase, partial [Acidimicrobiales bacterium]|nr:sensor domain-containing diguanylate cyclase [Acidimicrobiales bacterium]
MSRPRWVWLTAAALLVAVGAAGTSLGASAVARNEAQRSYQALVTSSEGIASTLKLAIGQESGLVVSAKAFVLANPNASNAEFLSWVNSMQVTKRFPDVRSFGFYAVVRPGQLSQFVARVLADPPLPLTPGQPYQVTPPGTRPFYCLAQLVGINDGVLPPLGYDACAAYDSSAQIAQAIAGNTYVPYRDGKASYLAVLAPVYSGEVVPVSAQARADTVLGFVGLTTLPIFELRQSLTGHPGTAVTFTYGSGASKVIFKGGSAPAGAMSNTVSLGNGWHLQISAMVNGSAMFGNPNARTLLLAGFVLNLLLGVLFYVLGTGRSRALLLVDERTSELHHLALYDPLTDLPNRALILDRIDKMLARSRRERTPVALLFLDLDNFKDVNDTLGHAAGDQLLVAVATRLTSAIR